MKIVKNFAFTVKLAFSKAVLFFNTGSFSSDLQCEQSYRLSHPAAILTVSNIKRFYFERDKYLQCELYAHTKTYIFDIWLIPLPFIIDACFH